MADEEKITLQEAFLRYRVPIATLRYWLDKRELTRAYDGKRRVVVDVAELEQRLEQQRRDREIGPKTDPGAAA